jgi:hypothetical protein
MHARSICDPASRWARVKDVCSTENQREFDEWKDQTKAVGAHAGLAGALSAPARLATQLAVNLITAARA